MGRMTRATRPTGFCATAIRLSWNGATLEAVETPGHAANHLCFALPEENALFSGDHAMAWSTSVIAPPDGSMTDYMASLEKLRRRNEAIFWPGHGGPVVDPQRYLRALIGHRRQREAAILARLERGAATIVENCRSRLCRARPKTHRRRKTLDPRAFGGSYRTRACCERRWRAGALSQNVGPLSPFSHRRAAFGERRTAMRFPRASNAAARKTDNAHRMHARRPALQTPRKPAFEIDLIRKRPASDAFRQPLALGWARVTAWSRQDD